MANAYPPIKIPPKQSKTTTTGGAFNAFIIAHPIMRPYADAIWKYSTEAGVDKVVAATLLWHEGFAEAARRGVDPNTIMSPTGEGFGPAQINPKVWIGKTTPWGETITQAKLADPQFNIRFGLTYFASLPGDVDQKYAAYSGGANYTLSAGLPKGYVPRSGLTPTEKGQTAAQQKAATDAAKTVLFDKWAVLGTDGRVKFVTITDSTSPPKNVLKYGPTPLTQTAFQTVWKQNYAATFKSYTGRDASGREVANILKNAPSIYTLSQALAQTPSFQKSPIFKAHGPGIVAIAKQVYGQDWKVDKAFVAKAIAENWDQATLEQNLRSRPEYFKGPAFQDDVAKATNVYTTIYGNPDANAHTWISDRVKEGWTPDDVAFQLRQDPAYKTSQEYKARVFSFAEQLGLITGVRPGLTAEEATLGGAPAAAVPTPPPSKPTDQPAGPPQPYNPNAYVPGAAPPNVAKAIQLAGKKGLNNG